MEVTRLRGVAGRLFPSQFLAETLTRAVDERERHQFIRWWRHVTSACGPASGLHAIFDVVAVPLFGRLGFRVADPRFERKHGTALLRTRRGTTLALLFLPWAESPPSIWRDAQFAARDLGAAWCFVLAPPFVSLADAHGSATRRSVDFRLPEALDARSFAVFRTLAGAAAFERGSSLTLDGLLSASATFQASVRKDLQQGVADALGALHGVLGPRRRDEALTVIFRILFLLFAESRDLLPRSHPIYGAAYAIGSMCRSASADARGLWDGLAAVTRLARAGCRVDELVVRPFNGALFAREAAPALEAGRTRRGTDARAKSRDVAMARALTALGSRPGAAGREDISYADLGVEQLGAVYERVLSPGTRKETGTFYTPQPLAEFVVRRTLSPLVAGATADSILALRVLDPAMGSGAFLVAACRYLAAAYARALLDEGRVSAVDMDDEARAAIRRLVAERCLAGVDRNPTAVQLARLSLWLTSLAGGKPLTFLDHHLRAGNSLIGTAPDAVWRAPSRHGRRDVASPSLFDREDLAHALGTVVRPLVEMRARRDDSVDDVRAKEAAWRLLSGERSPVRSWRLACDLWCAQWFAADTHSPSPAETRAAIDAVVRQDGTLPAAHLARLLHHAEDARRLHGFFHWPLEFADVFYDEAGRPRERPGFDAVIGNPPWEMVRNDTPDVAKDAAATGASREVVRFLRESGLYPHCDRGHVNLYQPFVERCLALTRHGGRVGLVLPWGFASDEGAESLRRHVLTTCGRHTLVGLDNVRGLFPIHRGLRFLAIACTPGDARREIRARFGVTTADELEALPESEDGSEPTRYPVRFRADAMSAVGGAAARIPDARNRLDFALLERLTSRFPALGSPAGWNARFGRELNATDDRTHFGARGLRVVEGKHLDRFTIDVARSTTRIAPADAARRLPDGRHRRSRLGYRDVSGVANRWSLIAAIVPANVVTTHTIFCLRSTHSRDAMDLLSALFNSYVLNAIVRMWMGGHVTTSLVESLPVPVRTGAALERRIVRRSQKLRTGRAGPGTEAALQADVARLYGIGAGEFRTLLEGFPLVQAEERERAVRGLEEN
jgi:hypothetical protein